ncbi:16S rRNA (uracil(1498)-N(3))-methyltransferase [hydrothermal vent metagenome]|uniref:16S rRNA (uracil(1498)-N(3))-methyltransferase n=1 Tax=hydrothermal vent metagenome TaxID=652676 RepID=A0A3B0ZXV8_9ZZZZ
MRTTRMFYNGDITVGNNIILPKKTSNHLIQVLRLNIDATIILFNGDGRNHLAKIIANNKNAAQIKILSSDNNLTESPIKIHISLALTKNDKMDFAIQKSVELGVTEITPLILQHSIVKLDSKKREKRHSRWLEIIRSACEQSGRSFIPTLNPIVEWEKWNNESTSDSKIICDPYGNKTLRDIETKPSSVLLLIGPEGGFSTQEILDCRNRHYTNIKFGQRILRAETAAIATITAVQTLWGDFS